MSARQAVSSESARKTEYSPQMHREMVAVAAYYRAERRGFGPGDPTADWLEAEAEIERRFQHAAPEAGVRAGPKQAFQQRLECRLRQWDTRLEQLRTKAKQARQDIRDDFEVQLEALAGKRALAQEKLQELQRHGEWAWEDLKDGANRAWTELRSAIDRAASRLK